MSVLLRENTIECSVDITRFKTLKIDSASWLDYEEMDGR